MHYNKSWKAEFYKRESTRFALFCFVSSSTSLDRYKYFGGRCCLNCRYLPNYMASQLLRRQFLII